MNWNLIDWNFGFCLIIIWCFVLLFIIKYSDDYSSLRLWFPLNLSLWKFYLYRYLHSCPLRLSYLIYYSQHIWAHLLVLYLLISLLLSLFLWCHSCSPPEIHCIRESKEHSANKLLDIWLYLPVTFILCLFDPKCSYVLFPCDITNN